MRLFVGGVKHVPERGYFWVATTYQKLADGVLLDCGFAETPLEGMDAVRAAVHAGPATKIDWQPPELAYGCYALFWLDSPAIDPSSVTSEDAAYNIERIRLLGTFTAQEKSAPRSLSLRAMQARHRRPRRATPNGVRPT